MEKGMVTLRTPGLVIAGTHSGVGKTTLTIGIMQVLTASLSVQPFKVGPDYIDPAFHTCITGRACRNLDGWLLDENTLRWLYARSAQHGGINLVEGVMGLYDGVGTSRDQGSTAHIAKLLGLPVALVIDGSGMAASAAALVLGYLRYDPELDLCAVIINNVKGEKHYRLLKEVVERDTGVRVAGYLPAHQGIELSSRHLGLVPRREVPGLRQKLEQLGELVRATVDLPLLRKIAERSRPFFVSRPPLPVGVGSVRLAVARDRAFNFYYEDSLELLRELGAELCFFSPLEARHLPAGCSGLYVGGGFPEVFARELAENTSLIAIIKESIAAGMPVYGECGGLMYLSGGIKTGEGDYYPMVGAFAGKTEMTDRLQRFGYVELEFKAENLLGKTGERIRAHEFHYSRLVDAGEENWCISVSKTQNGLFRTAWQCGIRRRNMLALYPHIHFYSNPAMAVAFLRRCHAYQEGKYRKRNLLKP
ncbi:MAG: cobyrinate a,c-diamide synthase [Bacillota bacterium]